MSKSKTATENCKACAPLAAATYPDGSLKMGHAVAVALAAPECTCGNSSTDSDPS